MSDAPHPSGNDRLAVYTVTPDAGLTANWRRARVATTSLDGLGLCLLTLSEEGEFDGKRVGVFDRETRRWLASPFSGTSPWIPISGD